MKKYASRSIHFSRQWFYLFPFLGLPLLFIIVVGLEKFGLLTGPMDQPILVVALTIFLSGGLPIIQSEKLSTLSKILLCSLYYLVSGVVIGFVGFFVGFTVLLALNGGG